MAVIMIVAACAGCGYYRPDVCDRPQVLTEVEPGHMVSCCRVSEIN